MIQFISGSDGANVSPTEQIFFFPWIAPPMTNETFYPKTTGQGLMPFRNSNYYFSFRKLHLLP